MDPNKSLKIELVKSRDIIPLTVSGVSERALENVLRHLEGEDELFDYNVPREWRNPKREGLQEFLTEAYFGNFEVVGEEAIKKYARLYDFVAFQKAAPEFGYSYFLKPGMRGIITKVELEKNHPLSVTWEACDEHPKEEKLFHTGENLVLLPQGIFRREPVRNKMDLLSEATPGRLVTPIEKILKYDYFVPVGTRGIITGIDHKEEYPIEVVFGNQEGYIAAQSGKLNIKTFGLKLFKENRFDIRKLFEGLK